MIAKLLSCIFVIFLSTPVHAEKSQILKFEGYSFYDGEKLTDQREIKVGGVVEAKGEVSYVDGFFQGIVFRVVGGKISVEKSFLKDQNGQKTQREGMRLHSGRTFFYVDKRIHDAQFVIKTQYCNFYVLGASLKQPAIFVLNKLKDRVALYVHQGVVKVTIPKVKKIKILVGEKKTWEYSAGPAPLPVAFNDERKLSKLLPIFEELKKN